MTIDLGQLRADVISDAAEDYWGLYEIIWSLNTQYPDVAADAQLAASRSVIADLVVSGTIELYEGTWPSNHFERIQSDVALTRLLDDAAWLPPTEAPYLSCLSADFNALNSER